MHCCWDPRTISNGPFRLLGTHSSIGTSIHSKNLLAQYTQIHARRGIKRTHRLRSEPKGRPQVFCRLVVATFQSFTYCGIRLRCTRSSPHHLTVYRLTPVCLLVSVCSFTKGFGRRTRSNLTGEGKLKPHRCLSFYRTRS